MVFFYGHVYKEMCTELDQAVVEASQKQRYSVIAKGPLTIVAFICPMQSTSLPLGLNDNMTNLLIQTENLKNKQKSKQGICYPIVVRLLSTRSSTEDNFPFNPLHSRSQIPNKVCSFTNSTFFLLLFPYQYFFHPFFQ